MAAPFTAHIITIGTNKFVVELPDEYENIADIVNIKKVTTTEEQLGAMPNSISALKKYGQLVSLRVGCGESVIKGRKLKYHSINCPVDKVVSAILNLREKNLGTQGTIQTIGFKRRRTRS